MLEAPRFDALPDYGARLGDAEFWRPWAAAVLSGCSLDPTRAELMRGGFSGTYPVLLDDTIAVKLFGCFGDWRAAQRHEVAALQLCATAPGLRVPRLVGAGALFEGQDQSWPWLVMETVPGTAWRDVRLTHGDRLQLAGEVGRQLDALHRLDPGAGSGLRRRPSSTPEQVAQRHREWGSLPSRLIDQLPGYLRVWAPQRGRCEVLVHADLTQDHLMVAGTQLAGIIDFGDAQLAVPELELGALQLGAFAGDRTLLAAWLDGYDWPRDEGLAQRALSAALGHEFDLFEQVAPIVASADSLDQLAERLFGRP